MRVSERERVFIEQELESYNWLAVANECSIGAAVYRCDDGVRDVLFRGNGCGGSTGR